MGLFDKLFGKTKKEESEPQNIEYVNPKDLWFTLPTISNEIPQPTNSTLYNDFEVHIHEDDWRQNEFLNISAFPLIGIEVPKIKSIWENDSKKNDDFTVFKNCHVRDTIGEPNLNIGITQLQKTLRTDKVGSL